MSILEIFAAVTGLLSVYLAMKVDIWNWFWGLVSVAIYGWVFWQSRLYSNVGLQILYFLPMQIYGWYEWNRGAGGKQLPISRLGAAGWTVCIAASVAFASGWGFLMSHYTNANVPYADAGMTGMSLVAQYLQTKKILENWIFWIAVDIVAVSYLFPTQHLYATTVLYIVLLVLCVMGYVAWRRDIAAQPLPAS